MSAPTEQTLLRPGAQSYGATPPPRERSHHNLAGLSAWHFRLACLSVWSATFLAAFDGTVVATLLSDIGSSFNAFHLSSWLGTAYLLSLCCFTPVYGRLADALGRRNAQLVALGFFTVGTAACAVAPNMYFLIAARCLAGIGGGGLTSVGSILLSDLVDLRHRGVYQGYANILYGLGASLGGPVGGWVADQFSWRLAFSAQVPFLIASMVAIFMFVPGHFGKADDASSTGSTSSSSSISSSLAGSTEQQPRNWLAKLKRIDYLGSTLLGLSVGSLLLGFSLKTAARKDDGSEYEWTDSLILGLFALFGIALLAFLAVEEWYAVEPVVPLSLLVRRTPAAVAAANLAMAMAMFSLMYNLPLYFTAVRLQSSAVAGAHLLPFSVFIGAGSLLVGAFMRSSGKYYPAMIVSGACVLLSTVMILAWDENSPEWLTWVAQSPAGFGYAGVLTSTLVAMMANVQAEGRGEIAVATALTYMARTIGQVLGVALSSALLQATLLRDLTAAIADPELVEQIRHSTAIIPGLPAEIRQIAVRAYAHGLHRAAVLNVSLAAVTLLFLACAENITMPASRPVEDEETS